MLQRFDYVFIKKVVHMCITFFTICEDLLTGPFFPLNTLCRFSFPTAKKPARQNFQCPSLTIQQTVTDHTVGNFRSIEALHFTHQ